MTSRTGLPGSRWRILTRNVDGTEAHAAQDLGIFDELVVGAWLHIEQLEARTWWMRVGDARLEMIVGDDGEVTVHVERGVYGRACGETRTDEPGGT